MWIRTTGRVGAALLLTSVLLAAPAWAAEVVEVRVGNHPTYTRVVFELDAPAGYRIERRSDEGVSEILVTMDAAATPRSVNRKTVMVERVAVQDGRDRSVAHIRLKQQPSRVKEMILTNPPRLVFDLVFPESKLAALRAREASKQAQQAQAAKSQQAQAAKSQQAQAAKSQQAQAAKAQQAQAAKSQQAQAAKSQQAQAAKAEQARKQAEQAAAAARAQREAEQAEAAARAQREAEQAAAAARAQREAEQAAAARVEREAEQAEAEAAARAQGEAEQAAASGTQAANRGAQPVREARPSTRPEAQAKPRVRAPDPGPAVAGDSLLAGIDWPLMGGAAAGVLLLAILFVMWLRRRALPNDIDVTALAEDAGAPDRDTAADQDFSWGEEGAPSRVDSPSSDVNLPARTDKSGPEITAGPGSDDEQEKESEMDSESPGLPMDRTTSELPTQVGGAASGDVARLLSELERRVAQLETRLDESVDARERLERQVAAQAEELRVQRAAIARTQRALRSLNRGEEDQATEPALREPSS